MIDSLASGTIAAFVVGFVLIAAAFGKALNFETAARGVQALVFGTGVGSEVSQAARLINTCLVLLEAGLGIAMVMGWSTRLSALAASGLFVLFGVLMSMALTRTGEPVRCGCLGSSSTSSWDSVLKNAALASVSLNAAGVLGPGSWVIAAIAIAAALGYSTLETKSRSATVARSS